MGKNTGTEGVSYGLHKAVLSHVSIKVTTENLKHLENITFWGEPHRYQKVGKKTGMEGVSYGLHEGSKVHDTYFQIFSKKQIAYISGGGCSFIKMTKM